MPAAVIALIFFLIGFWHLYWAMGGKTGLSVAIPEKEVQPIFRPGKFATVLVALLFVVFGCLARKIHHGSKKVAKSLVNLLALNRLQTKQQETSLMAECNELEFELPGLSGRKIEGNFEGGNVSSDGGLVLLRQVDRWIGLTKTLAQRLPDGRDPDKIEHSLESMLRNAFTVWPLVTKISTITIFCAKICSGKRPVSERRNWLVAMALCRLENRAGRKEAWLIHQILFDQFVGSFESAPSELMLDLDCTDDRVHGLQEGRHFHGYYYDFCFLPLYVFCGERLLVSYLRESNIDSAKHAWAILALLVKALRQRWPEVKITVRADSGFCRWKMLRWCERAGVNYIVGLAKNERLHALSAKWQKRAERKYQRSGEKVRLFTQFRYKAQSWGPETTGHCES